MRQAGWRLRIKQAFDRAVAAAGLVLGAPILLGTAAAIRVKLGSPVLFRQVRPGHQGKLFELVKFRTMRDAVDASGRPLPDDQRMTALGKFLRSTSLDELPQLYNVLRGDLSLVGPRPLLVQYLGRYTPEQARRHDVLPGITGWSQVNGRNDLAWPAKLALDVWYVEHWSLLLDFKVLLLTALAVIKRDGVSREGHATMPQFTGES